MHRIFILALSFFILTIESSTHAAVAGRNPSTEIPHVQIQNHPLFGAELQYFRLRGGYGRNIPREKVIALWNRALDRMVEAKMNTISFYIPWDFHEYAEGKFDFNGTADEDGDGNPDYPSRDLFTFFRLIQEHGIQKIMVRPGPYINAEWGFLGFGAIPLWFHEKYPDSHMRNSDGLRTKLYSYLSPDLLRHSQLWFKELHTRVLRQYMGPGKPILFLQIDNETNLMWKSLYNHDYGPLALENYRELLKTRYGSIEALNRAHETTWSSWAEVQPPRTPELNTAADQDWYRHQDKTIHDYLHKIRQSWESLGVTQPDSFFTLANTAVDHDLGRRGEGWRGIPVSTEARKQTYLTTLGHGIKGLMIDYFTEGDHWQSEWAKTQITPYFNELRSSTEFASYANQPDSALPNEFWSKLQKTVNEKILVGIDARFTWFQDQAEIKKLFFDAPLNGDAAPGPQYALLKEIGEKLIAPHQDFLGNAVAMTDRIAILQDSEPHVPSPLAKEGIDSVKMNSDWMSGLLGYVLQTGFNPQILHEQLTPEAEIWKNARILYADSGIHNPTLTARVKKYVSEGGVWINFLGDSMAQDLGFTGGRTLLPSMDPLSDDTFRFTYFLNNQGQLTGGAPTNSVKEVSFTTPKTVVFRYPAISQACQAVLYLGETPVGYRCKLGKGLFYQIGALLYRDFHSDRYATMEETPALRGFLNAIFFRPNLIPSIRIAGGGNRIVAFGRKAQIATSARIWITVKNGQSKNVAGKIQVQTLINPLKSVRVTDLFTGQRQTLSGKTLMRTGFDYQLPAYGSTVYWVEELM